MSDFEMQENEVEFKKKRPVFLLVLVILSGVNLVFSLFGGKKKASLGWYVWWWMDGLGVDYMHCG